MAAGMVPSAMAFGIGGEFRAPMAIAVIGGLLVSTGLSLVFVPAIFILMDDAQWFLARLFGRLVTRECAGTSGETIPGQRRDRLRGRCGISGG